MRNYPYCAMGKPRGPPVPNLVNSPSVSSTCLGCYIKSMPNLAHPFYFMYDICVIIYIYIIFDYISCTL